jgi:cbb3-type cytochrome oxidase maturation protein
MDFVFYLLPLALVMGLVGLTAFMWALRSGQYDDLEGSAWRAILDDDEELVPDRSDRRKKRSDGAVDEDNKG